MKFTIENDDKHSVVVAAVEKLDSLSAPDLKSELVFLSKSGIKNVVVDLKSCRYCDSSGLSALLTGNRLTKQIGGTFVICDLQPSVRKLVNISMLDQVFNITDTRDEAIDLVMMEEIERELDGDKS